MRKQIAEVVGKEKHAVPAEKPRSVDDVSPSLADELDELRKFLRRVLGIGVLNHDQIAGDFLEAEAKRGSLAAVGFLKQLEGILALQPAQDVGCAVLRPVVDHDQLDPEIRDGEHAGDHALDRVALVVDGHDDRQERIGELPFYAGHYRPTE